MSLQSVLAYAFGLFFETPICSVQILSFYRLELKGKRTKEGAIQNFTGFLSLVGLATYDIGTYVTRFNDGELNIELYKWHLGPLSGVNKSHSVSTMLLE